MRIANTFGMLLSASMLLSAPAEAQRIGTYSGTTADGNAIDFSVGVDSTTGKHAITFMGINFTTLCAGSGEQVGEGLGAGFSDGVDIVDGKATLIVSLLNLYTNAAVQFGSDGTVKGTILTVLPTFNPAVESGAKPTATQLCRSVNQNFHAAFQSSKVRTAPKGWVSLQQLSPPVGQPAK